MGYDQRQILDSLSGKTTTRRLRQREDRSSEKSATIGSILPAQLLPMVRAVEELLAPVRSRKAFREDLCLALMDSARRQYAQNAIVRSNTSLAAWQQVAQWFSPEQGVGNKRWIWGAAAVGSAASVAGIVAIALRNRQNRSISAS